MKKQNFFSSSSQNKWTYSAVLSVSSMLCCALSALAQPANPLPPGTAQPPLPQAAVPPIGLAPPAPPLEAGLKPPPPPPAISPPQGRPPEGIANRTSVSINGTVEQYLLNPHGEADGLYLTDGKQIHFPPHMSTQLLNTIRPGNKIVASGFAEGPAVFTAASITNSTNNRTVVDAAPQAGTPPLPPGLQGINLKQLRAQSKIKALLYGPRGDVNGYLLTDKTVVRMPPETVFRLSSIFQVGQKMTVEGYGSETPAGRCIEATALGTADQPLISIYGEKTTETLPGRPGL